jgi:hypothetical protein
MIFRTKRSTTKWQNALNLICKSAFFEGRYIWLLDYAPLFHTRSRLTARQALEN